MNKITCGIALIVGVAIGYWVHPTAEVPTDDAAEVAKKPRTRHIADAGDASQISALRSRLRDLESQLATRQRGEAAAVSNAVAEALAQRPDRPGRGGPWRERLEELKKRDPARFAQMTNRFARMHQERKIRQRARAQFLSSVNTSNMSAKDQETHDEYQQLLARREELEEQIHQPDMTDDTRHQLMDEMREINQQMRTLGESERKLLLGEVAQAIGMEGDAATELVQTVRDVFDATDTGRGPPGPPPSAAQP